MKHIIPLIMRILKFLCKIMQCIIIYSTNKKLMYTDCDFLRAQIQIEKHLKTRCTIYTLCFIPNECRNMCKLCFEAFTTALTYLYYLLIRSGMQHSSLVASDYAAYLNQCATKLSKLLFEYCITSAFVGRGFNNKHIARL